jgi:hypothetical protein
MRAGFHDHVAKPVTPFELVPIIGRVLGR